MTSINLRPSNGQEVLLPDARAAKARQEAYGREPTVVTRTDVPASADDLARVTTQILALAARVGRQQDRLLSMEEAVRDLAGALARIETHMESAGIAVVPQPTTGAVSTPTLKPESK